MRDLELPRFGLQVIPYEGGAVFTRDGDYLALPRPRRPPARNRAIFPATPRPTTAIRATCCASAASSAAADAHAARPGASFRPRDIREMLYLGRQFHGLSEHEMYDMVRFWTMSISDFLDEYFETDVIKA
jgi:phytoene dehydrogenase-like protein